MLGNNPHQDREDTDPDEDMTCGIGCFKPKCLQVFANINVALLTMCVTLFMYSFGWGISATGITSMQIRYGLPTWIIGLNASMFEVGVLVAVILVTYFGGGPSSHRPRWIGVGTLTAALGTFLVALVHFLFGPYEYSGMATGTNDTQSYILCEDPLISENTSSSMCEKLILSSDKTTTIAIMVIGHILIGAGFSPVLTLGISYIDDFAGKKKAPLYLGILQAMYPLGPVFGYPFASLFISYYVDIDKVDPEDIELTPQDPRWVGAWWLGYLIDAILLFLCAIPFLLLPKRLPDPGDKYLYDQDVKDENKDEMNLETGREIISRIKDFPSALRRLLVNVPFMTVIFGHAAAAAIESGSGIFFNKYMEEQFRITPTLAANLTGVSMIATLTIGIFLGGLYLHKTKPSLIHYGKMLVFFAVLNAILPIPLVFLGCEEERFAGVTVPYQNSSSISMEHLDYACNLPCDCTLAEYDPVCGNDDVTYYSPCYAGCTNSFYDCSCFKKDSVGGNSSQSFISYAIPGICGEQCNTMLIWFVIVCSVYSLASGIPLTCDIIVAMRCVDEKDKPFALAVRQFIAQLFGWIFTPLYMGAIIDSACILWDEDECGGRGACWLYDLTDYRIKLGGFILVMTLLSTILFTATLIAIKYKHRIQEQQKTVVYL
ncbi:solute carrier organic anion transporter family member 5A1-like [Saccoglossus kowalevskii]